MTASTENVKIGGGETNGSSSGGAQEIEEEDDLDGEAQSLARLRATCDARDDDGFVLEAAAFVAKWQSQRQVMETHRSFYDAELMASFVAVIENGLPASEFSWHALKVACLLARADLNTQALLKAGGVAAALSVLHASARPASRSRWRSRYCRMSPTRARASHRSCATRASRRCWRRCVHTRRSPPSSASVSASSGTSATPTTTGRPFCSRAPRSWRCFSPRFATTATSQGSRSRASTCCGTFRRRGRARRTSSRPEASPPYSPSCGVGQVRLAPARAATRARVVHVRVRRWQEETAARSTTTSCRRRHSRCCGT